MGEGRSKKGSKTRERERKKEDGEDRNEVGRGWVSRETKRKEIN